MRRVQRAVKLEKRTPAFDDALMLPGGDRKDAVIWAQTGRAKPFVQGIPAHIAQLALDVLTRLLLPDRESGSHLAIMNDVADGECYDVRRTEHAIDAEAEKRQIPERRAGY
jgi:hypothetical protein